MAVVIVAASVRADGQRQLSVVSRQTILEKDDDGKAIPGFALDDCSEIYGDRLDGPVMWKANTNGSALSGRLVRLRFVMSDADLYAFRFVDCRE